MHRLPVVGVMGSGSEAHAERAEPLGRLLAAEGVHLLTGGGGGAMEAASRAFAGAEGRAGLVLGVLPAASEDPREGAPPGYPNPWVEIAIRTHLHLTGERGTEALSRNAINVLSSDALVALPGGPGTRSELLWARHLGRPHVAFLRSREAIPGLPEGVPVEGELEAVARFLRAALGGRSAR